MPSLPATRLDSHKVEENICSSFETGTTLISVRQQRKIFAISAQVVKLRNETICSLVNRFEQSISCCYSSEQRPRGSLAMDSRRKSARLSGLSGHPQQELASLESEHKLRKSVKSGNGSKLTGQQTADQAAPAPAYTNRATSTDEGAAQSIPDEQQTQQPLETFISIIETYFGPQSDAEFFAAAEGVAEIWHLHDSSVRALLTDVLGSLLAKEEQLSQRAAAIAALKQARRDRFAEHGPRVSVC